MLIDNKAILRDLGETAVADIHADQPIEIAIPLSPVANAVMTGALSYAEGICLFAPANVVGLFRRLTVYQAPEGIGSVFGKIIEDPLFPELRQFDHQFDPSMVLICPSSKADMAHDYLDGELDHRPILCSFLARDGGKIGHGVMYADGATRFTGLREIADDFHPVADAMAAFDLMLANKRRKGTTYEPLQGTRSNFRGKKVPKIGSYGFDCVFRGSIVPLSRDDYHFTDEGLTHMSAKNSWLLGVQKTIPSAEATRSEVKVTCACGEVGELSMARALMPPEVISKKLQQRGWTDVNKKQPICPACNAPKEKPVSKADPVLTLVSGTDMQNATPDAKKQHRRIMEALLSVFDEDTMRYSNGYSDQRVADETSAPVNAVKKCREDYFGALAVPAEVDVVRSALTEAERMLNNLKAQTEDRIQNAEAEVAKLRTLWTNVARANGWEV